MIENTAEGVTIHALHSYSKRNGEHRPRITLGRRDRVKVDMDGGPENDAKLD